MIKRNNGFTLIEIIVVMALIAIFAMIAIPSFSAAISQLEAATCSGHRRSIQPTLQVGIILGEIEPSELNDELHNIGINCPAHGDFIVEYNEKTGKVFVECTKHTGTTTQDVLDKFTEMCENFKDYSSYESNSNLRDAMYELLGKTWNSIGFCGDDKDYYIQPYWNTTSNEVYLFAGTQNTAAGSWHTGYIYNAEAEEWYHGRAFSFVGSDISSWDDVWAKMQDYGWEPVEVEYEK